MNGIRVTQTIDTQHMSNTAEKSARADQYLIELFKNGRGCNLTLFNSNVVKEDEEERVNGEESRNTMIG